MQVLDAERFSGSVQRDQRRAEQFPVMIVASTRFQTVRESDTVVYDAGGDHMLMTEEHTDAADRFGGAPKDIHAVANVNFPRFTEIALILRTEGNAALQSR